MDICGSDDSDDFVGVKVEAYATKTSMNGKVMDCVRIRAPGAAAKAKKPAMEDDTLELNDDIPSNL